MIAGAAAAAGTTRGEFAAIRSAMTRAGGRSTLRGRWRVRLGGGLIESADQLGHEPMHCGRCADQELIRPQVDDDASLLRVRAEQAIERGLDVCRRDVPQGIADVRSVSRPNGRNAGASPNCQQTVGRHTQIQKLMLTIHVATRDRRAPPRGQRNEHAFHRCRAGSARTQ